MTREEALIYFPSGEMNLIDNYTEQLFQAKQTLVRQFPISKIYRAKILKLKIIEDAYNHLGGTSHNIESINVEYKGDPDSVSTSLSEYILARNRIRIGVLSADKVVDIESLLELLIDVTRKYALLWSEVDVSGIGKLIISKEIDPMELLTALNSFESNGNTSFNDISTLKLENPLVKEAKRLSLWLKMEGE